MKYLLSIYADERAYEAMSEDERREMYAAYDELMKDVAAAGHMLGGEGWPRPRARPRCRSVGRAPRHRRTVRGDQGAARRLLPDRRGGPRRRDRHRRDGSRACTLARSRCARSSTDDDRRRGRRPRVPGRHRARRGHPDQSDPRLRPGGRGLAGGLRAGAPHVAAARRAARPHRVAVHHGPQPRDRPAPPGTGGPGEDRRRVADRRARGDGRRHARDPGRPPAVALHLLPPLARPRSARRAHAAHASAGSPRGRSPGRSSCPSRRSASVSSGRSARSATPGSRIACRRASACRSGWTACCTVIYLVFNEGYAATAGRARSAPTSAPRRSASRGLLDHLIPDEPEGRGLLALLLLQHARRAARTDATGDLVTLDDQDRSPLGPRDDRRRARAGGRGAPTRPVPAPGRDRRVPRRGAAARGHRLAADRRPLRGARPRPPSPVVELNHAVGGRDGRRPRRRPPTARRRSRGTWTGTTYFHAAARICCVGAGRDADAAEALRPGARARRQRRRAALPRAP